MKNYVITGSIGHISKRLVEGLVRAGKNVSVISSSASKAGQIEKLGAKALTGSVQQGSFVHEAFQGADVVYTMIPPNYNTTDWRASQNEVAVNYANAIKALGIRYVVNLSSMGAHLPEGNGPVDGLYDSEQRLNAVPGLNVKHLRPGFFYYNFLELIGLAANAGILGANYGGGEQKLALVHTDDIAAAALDALLNLNFQGVSHQYIYSDLRTGPEIAATLGRAVGKELPWVQFTDEQQLQGMLQGGLPPVNAEALTQMGVSMRNGSMQEEILRAQPVKNAITLEAFAAEFREAWAKSVHA